MNTFVVDIWDDERAQCTFYTVCWEDTEHSETDRFLERIYAQAPYQEAVQELLVLITEVIGDTYGAIPPFFNRHENRVTALPHHGKLQLDELHLHFPEFPLRLYCLRLSDNLVVLFNGGIKSGASAQESKDLSLRFHEANNFAQRIETALREGMIEIDETGRKLRLYNGSTDICL